MNTRANTDMTSPPIPSTNLSSNRERLLQEINAVATETAALMKHASDAAGEQGDALRAGVEDRFHALQERFHALQSQVTRQTRQAAQVTDQYVHAHPWQSVGATAAVSLVAGVLIGVWIRRS